MDTRTLVLNSWGLPYAVVTWYDAITLVYQGKAIVLEEYDETVSSPSVTLFVPAVLQLKRAVRQFKRGVKFSRVNVFNRDGWRCQYCGGRFPMRQLNFDHVLPRRLGGKTTWDNIVTCCYACNDRKAGRTPEQAGMKLRRKPARPHVLPLHTVFVEGSKIPAAWTPYLDLSKAERYGDGFVVTQAGASA